MADAHRPGDHGKRRGYLIVLGIGLLTVIVLGLSQSQANPITDVLYPLVGLISLITLIGLLTRRLPMVVADVTVFGILALSLGFSLVVWRIAPTLVTADIQFFSPLIWAALLFPLAFLVFGTRRGGIVSVVTYLVFAVAIVPEVASGWNAPGGPTMVAEATAHMAFAYPVLITMLWMLSARLEQLTRMEERANLLAAEATTDALTGIANRRRLTDELDRLIAQAHRHEQPLAIVLMDLDHFKQINDELGHESGDHALVQTARRLTRSLRTGDIVGRWGGEEFVVIAPITEIRAATELAERCRQRIAAQPLVADVTTTASFGVAALGPDDDRRTLMRRADLALYAAKSEGRDRVVTLDDVSQGSEVAASDQ